MDNRSVWAVVGYPPDPRHQSGFSPRWHAFLKEVGRRWPLDVFALYDGEAEWANTTSLPSTFPVCHFWCHKIPPHPLHVRSNTKVRRALSFICSSLPVISHPYCLPDFDLHYREHPPKLVLCFLPYTAHFALQFPKSIPCIYVLEEPLHNLLNGWVLKNVPTALAEWVAGLEKWKIQRLYRRLEKSRHPVIAISDEEKDYFTRYFPPDRVTVIPHGIDCEFFQPIQAEEDIDVAVFGCMGHQRNYEPALDVYQQMTACPLRGSPLARWAFVGRDPHPSVIALRAAGALVTGEVLDIRPYYARAKVVLVPSRVGTGTKTTVLQAWAMGRPTVATHFAARGVPAQSGDNILLGESADELVDQIRALLASSDLRRRVAQAALKTVRRERDIRALSKEFVKSCESALSETN